jgi:hypothetical protein
VQVAVLDPREESKATPLIVHTLSNPESPSKAKLLARRPDAAGERIPAFRASGLRLSLERVCSSFIRLHHGNVAFFSSAKLCDLYFIWYNGFLPAVAARCPDHVRDA